MKKSMVLFISLFLALVINAQSPEKISYQAVIFDLNNDVVVNQGIGMQISILQGETYDNVVYIETHSPTTSSNGLVSIAIGTGESADDFSAIDWSNGPFFIKTETDPTQAGGTNYTISGMSQLLSVPYAMYAKEAGSVTESDPLFGESQAAHITETDITNLSHLSGTNSGDQDLSSLSTKEALADSTALLRSEMPQSVWMQNGDDAYYNQGNIGVGTSTPYSKLEVHDKIIAGSLTSTDGMSILEGRYVQSTGDAINTLGSMYSSGAWLMGYGMGPKTGESGYVSTCDNSGFERTGLELSNKHFKLMYAPSQLTTTGEAIADLHTPLYVNLESEKVGIGTLEPQEALDVNGVALSKFEGFSCYTTGSTISAGAWTSISIPNVEYDSFAEAAYNSSTGAFTAPRSGFYRFSLFGYSTTVSVVDGDRYAIGIQVNDVLKSFAGGNFSTADTPMTSYSAVVYLNANDVVKPAIYSSRSTDLGAQGTGHQFHFQGEFVGK